MTKTSGNFTDFVDFSRASSGTALRRIAYGSELVTNGMFDSDISGWTSGGIDGASVTWNNGVADIVGNSYLAQQLTGLTAGSVYRIRASVTETNSQGSIRVGTSVNSGGLYDSPTFSSTVDYDLYIVSSGTSLWLTLKNEGTVGDTSLYSFWDNISVKEVLFDDPSGDLVLFNHPDDIPRVEYDASGNVKGLLIEEARTNDVSSSEACSFVAQGTGVVTTSTTSAPYGLSSTVKRVQSSVLNDGAKLSVSVSTGGNNYCSVYVRSRTGADQDLKITASGTVGSTQVAPASGEWVRLGRVASLGAGNRDMRVLSTGDAIDLDIALPQVEFGSFPTSYIPTSGASADRSADICSIDVDQFGYNQKAGTVVVEFDSISLSNSGIYSLDSGTGNGVTALVYPANRVTYQVLLASSLQANLNFDDYAVSGQVSKVATVYGANDFVAVLDGGTIAADTAGSVPQVTTLRLGNYIGGGSSFDMTGHIKSIKYYPRKLTSAQLQELTS